MNRPLPLKPEHARVPDALPVFTHPPVPPLAYGWWTRFQDRWDGRRDRTTHDDGNTEVRDADTPWLTRLFAECHTAVAQERNRTEALVSDLDVRIAALEADLDQGLTAATELERSVTSAQDESVTDAPVGAGEVFSPPEERVQRRRLEQATKVARVRQQADAARAAHRQATQQIGVLRQERASHWVVLQERIRVLVEHYQRRAATYTRALERRRRNQFYTVPGVIVPAWASAELGDGGRTLHPTH